MHDETQNQNDEERLERRQEKDGKVSDSTKNVTLVIVLAQIKQFKRWVDGRWVDLVFSVLLI